MLELQLRSDVNCFVLLIADCFVLYQAIIVVIKQKIFHNQISELF
uniref:Uncharacterized protein n=1 Tax=Arundo donax TaxID=35708 RepID=A0A0A8YW32_ARUDO